MPENIESPHLENQVASVMLCRGRRQRRAVRRVDNELVVDEVVFGEPDLIEAQLLRPLHLLELAVNDLGVGERRRGLKKKKKVRLAVSRSVR